MGRGNLRALGKHDILHPRALLLFLPLHMDIQNIALLIAAVGDFFLAGIVYFKSGKKSYNFWYSIFCIFVGLWAFVIMLFRYVDDLTIALWLMRGSYMVAIGIAFSFLHFVVSFPEEKKLPSVQKVVFIGFTFFVGILIFFTSILVQNTFFVETRKEVLLNNIGKLLFGLYFIPVFFGSIYGIWKKYKSLTGILRLQSWYIFWAVLIPGILGSTFNLVFPFFDNHKFIWLGPIFPIFMNLTITYAILRYRLMDIHIIEKNLVVYAGLTLYTFSAFYAGANIFLRYVGDLFAPQTIIFEILLTILFVVTFIKISEQLTEVSEKKLFGSFFLYQQKLRELSQSLTTVIQFDTLIGRIAQGIIEIMQVERVGVLLKEEGGSDHYRIQKIIGFREENGISLVKDNFLTQYLFETKRSVIYEELQLTIRDTFDEIKRQQLETLSNNMKRIEAELCIPLFSKNVLQGIVVLGLKTSGEPYNQGELDLLETLASQASIAVENARLYDKIQDLNENLEAEVKEQTKAIQEQNVKLKELLEIKSEFLHIVSHQLRTPLTTLRGLLQFWKSGEIKMFSESQQKDMQEKIFLSTERLNDLIHDMLTAMDLEGGAFRFTFETVNLQKFINDIYEELRGNFEKKNIEFKMKVSREHIAPIMADPRYLREALSNVIDNAEKYTPAGSVLVTIEKLNEYAIIKVMDTGIGLTERDKPRLFSKFLRGERAEHFFPNGTGLGLYIAKQIIEGHKGKIEVSSQGENKGTTVTITLPAIQ